MELGSLHHELVVRRADETTHVYGRRVVHEHAQALRAASEVAAQLLDDLVGAFLALIACLEPHYDAPDVVAHDAARSLSRGRENGLHVRVLGDDLPHGLHAFLKLGECRAFRRNDVTEEDARVLPWNEALRDMPVELDGR